MKNSFAWFGVLTLFYILVTGVWVWFGFEYENPEWIEASRNFHSFMWNISLIYLGVCLFVDLLTFIWKKYRNA